jgi:hypothetical protein
MPEMPVLPPEPPPVQDNPKMSFYGLLATFIIVSLLFVAVVISDPSVDPIDLLTGFSASQLTASILIKVLIVAGLWSLIAELSAHRRAKKEIDIKRRERSDEIERARAIYDQELKIYQAENEKAKDLFHKKMESAHCGFTFLRSDYESWLHSGQEELKKLIIEKHLNAPLSQILYWEASPRVVFIPDKFFITETEIQPLSLRQEMPCAFYCVLPEELIIVPSSGVVMASPEQKISPAEIRNALGKSPLRVDIRSASMNALEKNSADIPVFLPLAGLLNYSLPYGEMAAIQFQSDDGIIAITTRDGRNALFSGTQDLYDSIRQALASSRREEEGELITSGC